MCAEPVCEQVDSAQRMALLSEVAAKKDEVPSCACCFSFCHPSLIHSLQGQDC